MNHNEAIIWALVHLSREGSIQEVREWLDENYPNTWKDTGTALADMVPESHGENTSSTVNEDYRVLERVGRGRYRILTAQ